MSHIWKQVKEYLSQKEVHGYDLADKFWKTIENISPLFSSDSIPHWHVQEDIHLFYLEVLSYKI